MVDSVAEILRHARIIADSVPSESSLDLPPVSRGAGHSLIQPWRRHNATLDHPLHRMMSRVGGFPASLARYFVAAYSTPGDFVLDPFCGKGTTLLEAACLGRNVIGGDIAPDAVIVSRAKSQHVTVAAVASYIESLPSGGIDGDVPDDVALFFHRTTLRRILAVREKLLDDLESRRHGRAATFACGVLLGLLHGHSKLSLSLPCNQAFAMAPNYVRRYVKQHALKKPVQDVRRCLMDKALTLLPMPKQTGRSHVFQDSADRCDDYIRQATSRVQLILSSPPYLNRQTYIRDSWLRLWFLRSERSTQATATLETGSIRGFIARLQTVLPALDRALEAGGRAVLVCGRAKIPVNGKDQLIKVADLTLYALSVVDLDRALVPERLISDRKLMNRGSYFAVHRGHERIGGNKPTKRFGEDEILVLRKSR